MVPHPFMGTEPSASPLPLFIDSNISVVLCIVLSTWDSPLSGIFPVSVLRYRFVPFYTLFSFFHLFFLPSFSFCMVWNIQLIGTECWQAFSPPLTAQSYLDVFVSDGFSPVSRVFSNLKRPAASRIRLNSMQNACTSMNKSCTLIILFLIKDWRKTQTRRTRRFCMYLSLICSQVEIQLEM